MGQQITTHHQATKGAYDFTRTRTLLVDEATGLGVLITDEWSGWDSIEGACYRPHLYRLSAAAVRMLLAGWETEQWDDAMAALYDARHLNPNAPANRYYGSAEDALARRVAAATKDTREPGDVAP